MQVFLHSRLCSETSLLPTRSLALWECYDANGNGEDIADAIEGFASDCQTLLELTDYPATATCEEFEDDFNLYPYMGEVCSPNCSFGGIFSSSSQCECDDGYWDPTCASLCPGGTTNPCNGFGTCDQTTGVCNCPINMMGSDDCTVCSNGWYGNNCDVTDNPAANDTTQSMAMLGQLGNVLNLDGLTFPIKSQGEMLILALADNVIIEGKFITCYTNYSCTPFISARIGDSSNGYATATVQSSILFNEKPSVFINGVQTSLDTTAYFNGFTIHRSDFLEVTFTVKNLITFKVRTVGQYLHFMTEIDIGTSYVTSGLLSGGNNTERADKLYHLYNATYQEFAICNSTASTQSVLSSESAVVLSVNSFTQDFDVYDTLTTSRYTVTPCDSIIYYATAAFENQTMGGYALSFSKSSLHDESFYIDTSVYTHLTFEMLVRSPSGNSSGVLFSFTSDIVFAIISGNQSIEVHTMIGATHGVYDTGLSIDEDVWNKIVLTYDTTNGETYFYVIYEDGATSTTGYFDLPNYLFNQTGTLSIGHWRPPSNALPYPWQDVFTGDIENFLVWNLVIEESQISQLHQMNPALASSALIYALQFNEGNGGKTTDTVTNKRVALPHYPWKAPEWIVSDLVYSSGELSYIAFSYFTDESLYVEADRECSSGLFTSSCEGMSNATLEFFYVECMQAIAATGQLTTGYSAILDAYYVCESQNKFNATAIDAYCESIPDTYRNGTSCSTSCPFGMYYSNGTCSCFRGYYGAQCDNICPGSSDSPCSNHGDCQTGGTCNCWWNWQGDSSCSSCSSNANGDMVGPECTILETTSLSTSTSKIGAVSSNGYFMTFDGQQISFIGETGAFLLFSSTNLGVDIHVYQVGCNYGSCVAAVSLESATTSVVIAPPGDGFAPVVYKNGAEFLLDDTSVAIDSYITVSQASLTEITVTITTLGTITVKVVVQEEFLQASVYTATTVCQSATGILGACGSGTDYSTLTESEIVDYIVANYKLSSSIILDALQAPVGDGSAITGYALRFNKTSAMTKPLKYPTDFSLEGTDYSLSLYWKPEELGGYIITYSKDIAFTIINDDPVRIQYQDQSINTVISPELNVWNQLVLTFKPNDGTIDVFHFGGNSTITHEILTFTCPELFAEGGTVMLGDFLPASETHYTYNYQNIFIGVIDEVSVWKNPIPTTLIYQAHLLSTKVSGFASELSELISFTEGVGTVAFDDINGNNIIIPKAPWQSPEWFVSDLGLQELRNVDSSRYSTNVIDPDVRTLCEGFFDSGTVASSCSRVSSFIIWWYKQNCMITATNSGNTTDVTMAMVDFASVCDVTGGTESALYDIICGLDLTKPDWLEQKCSGCLFGYAENGGCTCYYGYYGTICDSVCPGGVVSPCSGNGVCDKSGQCQCSGRFSGSVCDTCLTGWIGDECTIMKQAGFEPMTDTGVSTLVAQVNLLGQVAMFDGVVVDMPIRGYYELMTIDSADVSLFGRFAVCESAAVLHSCLIGFVIEHNGVEYYISHEAYDQVSSVEIMTRDSTLTLYDELELGDMKVKLESKTTMKITMNETGLVLKLSSISDRLLATMSLPKTSWDTLKTSLQGIITECDTEVAIKSSNCSYFTREHICNATTVPVDCEMPQTKDTLVHHIGQKTYNNTGFTDFIEEKYLSPLEPNCLYYSAGHGMTAHNVTLPTTDFALEMHVKPNQTGGVLMSFDAGGDYMVLLNHDLTDQLVLHTATKNYFTGLKLDNDQWNQITLAWRDAAETMELYLADDTGKIHVSFIYALQLSY